MQEVQRIGPELSNGYNGKNVGWDNGKNVEWGQEGQQRSVRQPRLHSVLLDVLFVRAVGICGLVGGHVSGSVL